MGTGDSTVARAGADGTLTPLVNLHGLVQSAVWDGSGGVWYALQGPQATLLWTDGHRAQVISQHDFGSGRPIADINLAPDGAGGAWALFIEGTVQQHAPTNLVGVGDYGGRVVAVHITAGRAVQRFDLPPLFGASLAGLAVGPDGRLWFTTTQAQDTATRALYAFDPATNTAQAYAFTVLGRVLDLTVNDSGVWLRVVSEAMADGPVLYRFDPTTGATANVIDAATAIAAAPDDTLYVASQGSGEGAIYHIGRDGQLPGQPAFSLDQAPSGLVAAGRSLWALTPARLYQLGG